MARPRHPRGADSREDGGRDFAAVLKRAAAPGQRPDPRSAVSHLERFSRDAFAERIARILPAVYQTL